MCAHHAAYADNENRAKEVEHHKQDQLQKQKDGKGHWTAELASDSESIVSSRPGAFESPNPGFVKVLRG